MELPNRSRDAHRLQREEEQEVGKERSAKTIKSRLSPFLSNVSVSEGQLPVSEDSRHGPNR